MERAELMTSAEVIKILKISRTTLQRLIAKKIITPVNEPNPLLERPKTFYFKRSEIEALLNGTTNS